MENANGKKNIWIVNYYSTPPAFVSNPRHLEFAHNLINAGYNVTIISASFLLDRNLDLISDDKRYLEIQYGEYKFIHIKVKHYAGNGLSRMFSIYQFAYRLLRYRKRFDKPDIILHNIHAPFDYPVSICAKKMKAQYIVEAWDLWPLSFVQYGLISKKNPLVNIAYNIEKKLYEKADKIIFTFEGGPDYLRDRRWTKELGGKIDIEKIIYINNGVNINEYNNNKELYKIHDADLEDDTLIKVIYLGSIRLVNNVKKLIDAAALLKDIKNLKFLIYGDGSDRVFLENYCNDNKITNVVFKEKWIPLRNVPYVLSKGHFNLLNYQKSLENYGTSSGKLFLYLASGKPICCNVELAYCLIKKHKLGIARYFEDEYAYADAIRGLVELDKNSYNSMCERVTEVAEQFDYKLLSDKLVMFLRQSRRP